MSDQTIFDDSYSKVIEATKAGADRPVLVILDGGDLKLRYRIDEREIYLGRDVTCQVVVSDTKCSRKHTRLTYLNYDSPLSQPRVMISDLKSTNGTFVNGARVTEVELHDRDKIMIGSTLFGFFLRDETSIKADENLIKLASYDPLTNVYNRGIFNLEAKREFDRARRYQRPLSLAMFDIDHFKKFNDTYGHQTGDNVLKELGSLVIFNCRSNDIAARFGGEEFAVLLPETPIDKALIHAERLRKAVMKHSFSAEQTRLGVTVSIGVSQIEEWMEDATQLIEAADRALYKAKASGRNQVCSHAGPLDDLFKQAV